MAAARRRIASPSGEVGENHGLVLSVLNNAVDEAAEAVFSAGRSRAAVRLYHLARQVLEFRRAAAPMAEMLDRPATESQRRPATGSDGTFASSAPT
jgi:hypothetical protein